MALLDVMDTPSPIHQVDPRTRLLVFAPIAVILAITPALPAAAGGLGSGLLLVAWARIPARPLLRRLLLVNAFVAAVGITFPLSALGIGADAAEALQLTALKANALVLWTTALASTMELTALGHALAHLRAPRALTHLLLMTVRYTEVLYAEQERLLRALRARSFRPRADLRSLRTIAHVAGLLLVRSIDRAERVLAAMRCRGYDGTMHLLHHFRYRRIDVVFAAAGAVVAAALLAGSFA